jgi:hypothetical protein
VPLSEPLRALEIREILSLLGDYASESYRSWQPVIAFLDPATVSRLNLSDRGIMNGVSAELRADPDIGAVSMCLPNVNPTVNATPLKVKRVHLSPGLLSRD